MIHLSPTKNVRFKYSRFTISRKRLTGSWGELPERYYLGHFEFRGGFPLIKVYHQPGIAEHVLNYLKEHEIEPVLLENADIFPTESPVLLINEISSDMLDAVKKYQQQAIFITTTRRVKNSLKLRGYPAFYFEEIPENSEHLRIKALQFLIERARLLKLSIEDIQEEIKNQEYINSVEINRICQYFGFREKEAIIFLAILAMIEKSESDAVLLPHHLYIENPALIEVLDKIIPNAPASLGEGAVFWKLMGATTMVTTGIYHPSHALLQKSPKQTVISATPLSKDGKEAKAIIKKLTNEKTLIIFYNGTLNENVVFEKHSKGVPHKFKKKPKNFEKFPEVAFKLDELLEKFPLIFLTIKREKIKLFENIVEPRKRLIPFLKKVEQKEKNWVKKEKIHPTFLSIWL